MQRLAEDADEDEGEDERNVEEEDRQKCEGTEEDPKADENGGPVRLVRRAFVGCGLGRCGYDLAEQSMRPCSFSF